MVIYIFLNVCSFDYTDFSVSGKVGSRTPVNHTSWVAVFIPTDRPKLAQNRCVINVLVSLHFAFEIFRWCKGFFISSFFSFALY